MIQVKTEPEQPSATCYVLLVDHNGIENPFESCTFLFEKRHEFPRNIDKTTVGVELQPKITYAGIYERLRLMQRGFGEWWSLPISLMHIC